MIFSQIFCIAQEQLEIFRSSIKFLFCPSREGQLQGAFSRNQFTHVQARVLTVGDVPDLIIGLREGARLESMNGGQGVFRLGKFDFCTENFCTANPASFNWIYFSSRIAIFMPNIVLKVISTGASALPSARQTGASARQPAEPATAAAIQTCLVITIRFLCLDYL